MRAHMQTVKFANRSEFGALVEAQDDYRLLPINSEYAGRHIFSDKIKGMVNITRGRMTMACGKNYPVFGHREALGYVAKELDSRKLECHGSITTVGDTTWTKILFNGLEVKDQTDSRVEMGVEFVNPMDRKTKFVGHGYTFRQTCSNGAGVKNLLPNLEINESHTSTMLETVPVLIHDFISRSLTNTNYMQQIVHKAMETKVVFESKAQLTATLTGLFSNVSERHVKAISNTIDVLDPTRWDLFNASNFYTSHHAISPSVREDIDTVAEQFLNTTRPIVPAIVVRQVAPMVL